MTYQVQSRPWLGTIAAHTSGLSRCSAWDQAHALADYVLAGLRFILPPAHNSFRSDGIESALGEGRRCHIERPSSKHRWTPLDDSRNHGYLIHMESYSRPYRSIRVDMQGTDLDSLYIMSSFALGLNA